MALFRSDGTLGDDGADVLYAPYVQAWSPARVQRIITGERLLETDVTELLCSLIGDAGDALVDHLLTVAALDAADRDGHRYQLIRPTHVRANRRRLASERFTEVGPDIIVERTPHGSDTVTELVVAVEVKRNAAVNYIDCPAGTHSDYSNQLVCYVENCWLAEDSPSRQSLRHVWMAPAADLTPGVFPRHALNGTERQYRAWNATKDAYDRQAEALARWHTASLEDLADALSAAAPDVAELVRCWAA